MLLLADVTDTAVAAAAAADINDQWWNYDEYLILC